MLENVSSWVHAAHWRSVSELPTADMPSPAAQVLQVVHAVLPAPTLKWPLEHTAQARSADVVAALDSARPAPHGALTAEHAPCPLVLENVEPVTQGAHRKSAVAEPLADTPSPATQLRHSVHALLPA